MEIFKQDELLDSLEDEKLDDDLAQNALMRSLGFNFSIDRNKLIKPYDNPKIRTRGMNPMTSHLKTLNPFDLVFNSQLLKSKLMFDSLDNEPKN